MNAPTLMLCSYYDSKIIFEKKKRVYHTLRLPNIFTVAGLKYSCTRQDQWLEELHQIEGRQKKDLTDWFKESQVPTRSVIKRSL